MRKIALLILLLTTSLFGLVYLMHAKPIRQKATQKVLKIVPSTSFSSYQVIKDSNGNIVIIGKSSSYKAGQQRKPFVVKRVCP